VPRLLTDDWKLQQFSNCQNLLQGAHENKDLLKNVITGDETWVYGYDTKTKQQSSHWKSHALLHPKKAQQVHLRVRTMLLVFLNH
jgi:hypothetical protein